MKKTKLGLIGIIVIGGLLFGASLHPSKVMALSSGSSDTSSDSSSTPTDTTDPSSNTTNSPSATTTPAAADQSGSSSPAPTTTTPDADTSVDTTPTTSDSSQTPPCDPSSTTDPSSSDSSSVDLSNNTAVNNCINGDAQSGDASVTDSSQGGNATTGSAGDTANLVNSVGSTGSLANGGVETNTENVNGNVDGNITVDPTNPSSDTSTSTNPVSVDISNNTAINNNVDLTAGSGNADVSNNQVGGNATSGTATTEANIINLADSSVSSGQAYIEIININGTLDGNIVIPESLVSGLLGDPNDATPEASAASLINNAAINNNVELNAQSGDALVSNNQVGGNATSGNAIDNLNIYDLVGSDITGGNMLLVFVNVAGQWVGFLLNDPAGTTTAALGGEIEQDVSALPATDNSSNVDTINNNIDLSSVSGNATVAYNQNGGNATTGNASSTVNLVNIIDSDINLSGWLDILIINVLGTWDGSLVIQQIPPAITTTDDFIASPAVILAPAIEPPSPTYTPTYPTNPTPQFSLASFVSTGSSNIKKTIAPDRNAAINDPAIKNASHYLLAGIIVLAGILILAIERFISRRQKS